MVRTGYCSICKRADVKTINKAIAGGASFYDVREDFPNPPAKATFYKHKQHITSPLLTDAETARKNPTLIPRSNREVLEAIRDIGLQNAMDDPSKITPNHAIRAAQILAEKEKKENIQIVLAKLVQGPPPPLALVETVEGDYYEDGS